VLVGYYSLYSLYSMSTLPVTIYISSRVRGLCIAGTHTSLLKFPVHSM